MECASVTEIAVALNVDWAVVDVEHGNLDYKDAMDHVRVVRDIETSVIIRDSDIHGVILPMESAADVERRFRFGRNAPRGIGSETFRQTQTSSD